jgi:hypothetical protein
MSRPSTIHTELLCGAADFVRSWDAIQSLREDLGVQKDVLLNPLHFLASTDETRKSCSVACWEGDRLIGLLYATEHYVRGHRTGYAIAGDFVGRGSLLCPPERQAEVARLTAQKLLAAGIHSLHLRMIPMDRKPVLKGLRCRFLESRVPGDRMCLPQDYQQYLATLGKHTRRNIRYYTRKAEAEGIHFVADLTREEYLASLDRLNVETMFPVTPRRFAQDERLLALHGGGRRFGLRSATGELVAVLCGFSHGGRFHLLTQLNDHSYKALSLSLVLRGYTIENLIRSGNDCLQFMGGASLSFSRFCFPLPYRSILIDRRWGALAAVKFLTAKIVQLASHFGLRVPEALPSFANGYLDEANLVARTILAPAAVAFGPRASHLAAHTADDAPSLLAMPSLRPTSLF